ncbi:MAG: ABC transporter permease [Chloroflexi bacterium]|nr:ABC transporter permease [Chloroflexota bacterium]
MTFSVVQRRPLFGTLRCLGVTRREVFLLVISEALVVGVIGSVLGIALGILLGQGAVRAVTQTINDLFFVVTVRGVAIPAVSLAKGAAIGIVATVLTAAPPAWEAASVPPRAALSRSGLESKAVQAVNLTTILGVIVQITGFLLLLIPTRDLVISFTATFLVVVGAAMLTPMVMSIMMRLAPVVTSRLFGVLGRMAPRDVVNSLSRTSIAVAALMVAVSVTIGISLMVSSFRNTVVVWLEQTLRGDIYVTVPSGTQTQSTSTVDPEAVGELQAWPGVQDFQMIRSVMVDSPDGMVNVAAVSQSEISGEERLYYSTEIPVAEIDDRLREGAVIVSEPFARANNLMRGGGEVTFFTDQGERSFDVVGIYYDYGRVAGTVLMDMDVYQSLWNDHQVTGLALYLEEGTDPDILAQTMQDQLAGVQGLLIQSNESLRQEVLVVFDRTFAITGALQVLVTIIAFVGVLSALLSLQLEKQRELGILRAIGLTVRQMWGLVMIETGLMGAVAGLLAMPTGFALSLILIYIINRRSFGWTLQLQFDAWPFVAALLVAVTAALLAGIYPARRISQMTTADAIRFE